MRIKARALPANYKLTETERIDYQNYIAAYLGEYENVTASDVTQLEAASLEHCLALRVIAIELETGRSHLNSRYSHLGMERAILNDLALSRSARLREKPTSSSEADQLRDLLFSLSDGRADAAAKNGVKHGS